jgi:hypothetical protein
MFDLYFLLICTTLKVALSFIKILTMAQHFKSQIICISISVLFYDFLSFTTIHWKQPPPLRSLSSVAVEASHPKTSSSLKWLERLFQCPHEQLWLRFGFFRKQKCFTFWCRKPFLVDFGIGFLKLNKKSSNSQKDI